MSNVIIRIVNMTASFQPLASERTVGTFTIIVPQGVEGVTLQSDDNQSTVPLSRGDRFTLERINLQDIYASGPLNDYLIVIGATAK